MATTNTGTKLKRQRGRPSASKQEAQPATAYDFPSLDDIQRMTDAQVQAGFQELGVEPSHFRWHDDTQWNISLWADYPISMSPADPLETPQMKGLNPDDPVAMEQLKTVAFGIYQRCLRTELLAAYIQHWVTSLDDIQLIQECERLSGDKLSESEKRYIKRAALQERVAQLTWPDLVKQSKLYVPSQFTKEG